DVKIGGEAFAFRRPQSSNAGRHRLMTLGGWLATGGMKADNVVEQRTGRGLAGFEQPETRQDSAAIGSPYALAWTRIGRQRQHRVRGAGDKAKRLDGCRCPGPQHTEQTGMGIDCASGDTGGGGEAERFGGGGGERAEIAAGRHGGRRQAGALDEIAETDLPQERTWPATLAIAIPEPFAGEARLRAGRRASGTEGEEVDEIDGGAHLLPAPRQAPLEPHELGDLHLGRHDA